LFKSIRLQCVIIIIITIIVILIIKKQFSRFGENWRFFLQDRVIFKKEASELTINSCRTSKSYVSFRKIEVTLTCRIRKSQGTFRGTYCLLIGVKFWHRLFLFKIALARKSKEAESLLKRR